MMGWYGGMMGGYGLGLFGFLGIIFWLIAFIDLILFGIWLWKQIQRSK